MHHHEIHRSKRVGWLRAAVLGAEDGIVSTAALMLGVAASTATSGAVLIAGLAGLVAGALSMAAGEYVSVSSQRDAERADIAQERRELSEDPAYELDELTDIYARRGLDRALSREVATKMMEVDPLGAHLREELGFSSERRARPLQAALASAVSFAIGGALPLAAFALAPPAVRIPAVALTALGLLGALGALGSYIGGARGARGALRVLVGGGAAIAVTGLIGGLVGGAAML